MKDKFDIFSVYHKERPLSWSAISSFEYDPEQWYNSYILGIRQESKQLAFGSWVDNKLQTDPTFLSQVERFPVAQYAMRASLKGVVPLIGYADGWDPTPGKYRLNDDKTGVKAWTQKRANDTGQLTCYAFLIFLTTGIKPEEIDFSITWLPTEEKGDFSIGFKDNPVVPKIFHTKRNMVQVLEFGKRVKDTLKDMEEYATMRMLSTPEAGTELARKV